MNYAENLIKGKKNKKKKQDSGKRMSVFGTSEEKNRDKPIIKMNVRYKILERLQKKYQKMKVARELGTLIASFTSTFASYRDIKKRLKEIERLSKKL